MKIPTFRFDHDVDFYPISDLHRADYACDVPLWNRVVDEIYNNKIAQWAGVGDWFNCAIWGSKSDPNKSLTLNQENKLLRKEVSPIANKGLVMIPGNHEDRLEKQAGYNLTESLAEYLKVPYSDDLTVICIICGRCAYYIAMCHGTGGGRKQGSKTNALIEFSELISGCDVYIEGHSHAPQYLPGLIPYVDKKRGIINYHNTHYVANGHFLEWSKSYARKKKWKPKPKGIQKITLFANNNGAAVNKKVEVKLFS